MSMYATQAEYQTLAQAITCAPKFQNMLYQCAWLYSCYDGTRRDVDAYMAEHKTNRPTKERERMQIQCSRAFGEFWATLQCLHMVAEAFGPIHTGTIHDEIIELSDGHDTIRRRRELLTRANAC